MVQKLLARGGAMLGMLMAGAIGTFLIIRKLRKKQEAMQKKIDLVATQRNEALTRADKGELQRLHNKRVTLQKKRDGLDLQLEGEMEDLKEALTVKKHTPREIDRRLDALGIKEVVPVLLLLFTSCIQQPVFAQEAPKPDVSMVWVDPDTLRPPALSGQRQRLKVGQVASFDGILFDKDAYEGFFVYIEALEKALPVIRTQQEIIRSDRRDLVLCGEERARFESIAKTLEGQMSIDRRRHADELKKCNRRGNIKAVVGGLGGLAAGALK